MIVDAPATSKSAAVQLRQPMELDRVGHRGRRCRLSRSLSRRSIANVRFEHRPRAPSSLSPLPLSRTGPGAPGLHGCLLEDEVELRRQAEHGEHHPTLPDDALPVKKSAQGPTTTTISSQSTINFNKHSIFGFTATSQNIQWSKSLLAGQVGVDAIVEDLPNSVDRRLDLGDFAESDPQGSDPFS